MAELKQKDILTPAQLDELDQALLRNEDVRRGFELRNRVLLLGRKLRQLREQEVGLSQRQAAQLLGMEQPELSRIENGTGPQGPSYMTLMRIVDGYGAFIRARQPEAVVQFGIDIFEGGELRRHYALEEEDEAQQQIPAGHDGSA